MVMQTPAVILLLIAPFVLSQGQCPPSYAHCRFQQSWHLGADRVRPSGTVVHGHANTPPGNVQGTVHGSHVFGGPYNGAQTVGGGLKYQNNGLGAGVDVTHNRGHGNTVSAGVGGSTKLGPGTLSVNGGATKYPGSSHIQGQVGATYSVPLP